MRVGIEAEGRFKGLVSIFITAEEFLNSEKAEKVERHFHHDKQQVYIVDRGNKIDLNDVTLEQWSRSMIVTVERTGKLATVPSYIHIVLSLEFPAFWLLRKTDDFKIHRGYNVAMVNREQMVETVPSDFANDKVIPL